MALVKYIFVDSQKEKAIELKDKLDTFKDKIDWDLNIEIRIAQAEKKELDDLLHMLGENRLPIGQLKHNNLNLPFIWGERQRLFTPGAMVRCSFEILIDIVRTFDSEWLWIFIKRSNQFCMSI